MQLGKEVVREDGREENQGDRGGGGALMTCTVLTILLRDGLQHTSSVT